MRDEIDIKEDIIGSIKKVQVGSCKWIRIEIWVTWGSDIEIRRINKLRIGDGIFLSCDCGSDTRDPIHGAKKKEL